MGSARSPHKGTPGLVQPSKPLAASSNKLFPEVILPIFYNVFNVVNKGGQFQRRMRIMFMAELNQIATTSECVPWA
ncbi:hypothetical protein NKR19_g5709 [Coniochaeta hoffmannii]|uniref:Uncharacterized protein n=1 Tax=Coniochaeta hoffmannii TaxID=91930 RepID=A0AA38S2N0_9PEZI|nr:hypothetical protein NKR19_g5709 [Coniochaeta hoffmannii]